MGQIFLIGLLALFICSEAWASWVLWEQEVIAESSEPIQDFEHQPVSRAKKIALERVDSEAECLGARDGLLEGYFTKLTSLMAEEVTRGTSGLSWFAVGRRRWTGILWSCVQDNERGASAPMNADK